MRRLQSSKLSSSNARRARLAFTTSLLLTLSLVGAGCATNGGMPLREPVTRTIPGPPTYLQPAAVPPAREGSSPYVVAEQRKQVIVHQNKIITGAKAAWSKMKDTYHKSFLGR